MNRLGKIRKFSSAMGAIVLLCALQFYPASPLYSQVATPPERTVTVVSALQAAQWQELENGLQVIRAVTERGVLMTAFRISQEEYDFSIALQENPSGSFVKEIGEQEGALVAANAGFFAASGTGSLYSVGYLRLNGKVYSKGWDSTGGIVSFKPEGVELTPSADGIPQGDFDVIQSKPMLIEPGSRWSMGSNTGGAKPRTILCRLADGDIVLAAITRVGLTLYESGWVMRKKSQGGFFDCDSALAFDGGRSTQVWFSGDEKYSSSGISAVHNFFVVRNKEN